MQADDKGTGRKYPEANARIVRLTYDTAVMKGSLGDTNASITPAYHKSPSAIPFHPAANSHIQPEVTFGLVTPVPKKIVQPLTSDSEKLYLLG
jgi:hypothetical protein